VSPSGLLSRLRRENQPEADHWLTKNPAPAGFFFTGRVIGCVSASCHPQAFFHGYAVKTNLKLTIG
jgi:hypothetical protein